MAATEQLGEVAGEAWLRSRLLRALGLSPSAYHAPSRIFRGSGRDVVDMVFEIRRRDGGESLIVVIEAKGAGGRLGDVVRLTAQAGGRRRRVDPGRYLVDYKAGERAIDLDQARRYAETLAEQSDHRGLVRLHGSWRSGSGGGGSETRGGGRVGCSAADR